MPAPTPAWSNLSNRVISPASSSRRSRDAPRPLAATKRQPLLSLARLEPGQRVVLELRSGEYTGRYESRLLARHAATIVVACPQIGGVAFSPAFGTRVSVGYALGDGWYRFETTVIGSTHEDKQPALLLAQPRLVTHLQRRRFPRYAASLPARWMLPMWKGRPRASAQVLDASRGGLRISAQQAALPGARLTAHRARGRTAPGRSGSKRRRSGPSGGRRKAALRDRPQVRGRVRPVGRRAWRAGWSSWSARAAPPTRRRAPGCRC